MKNLTLLLLAIPALLASAADTKKTFDDLAADRSQTDTERLRQLFDLEWERVQDQDMPRAWSSLLFEPAATRNTRNVVHRSILSPCESAICAAGFRDAVLVATLAGEPLYASFGYSVAERCEIPLSGGLTLPAVRMVKRVNPNDRNA